MAPGGVEVEVAEGRSVVEAKSVQGPIPSLQCLFDRLGLGFVAAQWAR